MKECELCKNVISSDSPICKICGYDNASQSIYNEDDCISHYQNLKLLKEKWFLRIEFLSRLKNLTKIANTKIATLFKMDSRSSMTRFLNLAHDLKVRPELRDYPSITAAVNASKYRPISKIIKSEEDLQKELYMSWDESDFGINWSLIKNSSMYGKFKTDEVGEIDLLAKHKKLNKWLVVELKLNQSPDDTVGQILRYMGWIKKNYAQENDIVEGLIICGGYNIQLDYALSCVKAIQAYVYNLHQNKLEFLPFQQANAIQMLESLDTEERKKVFSVFLQNKD